jgi:surface antigen
MSRRLESGGLERTGAAASRLAGLVLAAGLAIGATPALAQHAGHGGGGGGGWHGGGGGWHGGGWHGGSGWHGGWHGGHGGWGWGWGWGGWWYPGFSLGFYNPYYWGPAPSYYGYAYPSYPYGYYPPYAPQSYDPSGDPPADPSATAVMPQAADNGPAAEPALYATASDIGNGSCNPSAIAQAAGGLTNAAVSAPENTIAGLPVGRLANGRIEHRMNLLDQACVMQTLELARTDAPVSWRGRTGEQFEARVTRTYYRDDHQPCREFTVTAEGASASEEAHGAACREPDGSWRSTQS